MTMETSTKTSQTKRVDRLRADREKSLQILSHFDFTAIDSGDDAEFANREESNAVNAILVTRLTERNREVSEALNNEDVDHCKDCGERISAARKAALVHVQRCIQCQRTYEKSGSPSVSNAAREPAFIDLE